jgi:hypothetical protein
MWELGRQFCRPNEGLILLGRQFCRQSAILPTTKKRPEGLSRGLNHFVREARDNFDEVTFAPYLNPNP